MEYEDYKQLSDAIKDIEETVFCAMEELTSASPIKYAKSLINSRKHLMKMRHILDRQLHFEHAPPEPWSSHDLFF